MRSVIIVGPDHQNTLGVIRAVGKEGYLVNLLIYSDGQHECKCKFSSFVKGQYINCPESEKVVVENILKMARKGQYKIPVIPTSDFAAMCIDKNYQLLNLSQKLILPSIRDREGMIFEYMDKYAQKKLAEEYDIKMAKTLKIKLPYSSGVTDIGYPCVLKPVVSAKGLKSDIIFANNFKEFQNALLNYYNKGYCEVLVQEFINKDFEVCVFGCITKNSREFYCGALRKIRYSPVGDGASLSFGQFTEVDERYKKIINLLKDIGYNGLFDIEMFAVGDLLYLNEINFRNSGNGWAIVNCGINAPVIWIKDRLGERINCSQKHYIDDNSFFMNETADLRNVMKKRVNIFRWGIDLFRTKSFNKFWKKDIKGSLVWYRR